MLALSAQKNVTPVRQTRSLELRLPDGSRQDKRLVSVLSATTLLGMESKKEGTAVTTTEVYYLPAVKESGYNSDSLVNALIEKGFEIAGVEGDDKFAWAVRGDLAYLLYFATESAATDLYIGSCDRVPGLFGSWPEEAYLQSSHIENNVAETPGQVADSQYPHNLPVSASADPAVKGLPAAGYRFNRSEFDDGWVSSVQVEWVHVARGRVSVYLFYALPYNSDNFTGTGVMDRDYYWDNYVAGRFGAPAKQYRDDGEFVSSMKPRYAEGWGTDPVTGDRSFIAMTLSVAPNSALLTVATAPDEAAMRQLFPKANDKWSSDLTAMSRYNKFAISPGDLSGQWQDGNTATAQWYYVSPAGYEGYAGMTVASSSATFIFNNDATYTSIHNGATGAVGAMSTFQQEYRGSSAISEWAVRLTNRWQGATQAFDAHFQAVAGGRLLYLNDNAGQSYLLVRAK